MRGAVEGNGAGGLEEETHTQIPPMNLEARQPVHVTTPMNLEARWLHATCPRDHLDESGTTCPRDTVT